MHAHYNQRVEDEAKALLTQTACNIFYTMAQPCIERSARGTRSALTASGPS
jgi:hypothetical protein